MMNEQFLRTHKHLFEAINKVRIAKEILSVNVWPTLQSSRSVDWEDYNIFDVLDVAIQEMERITSIIEQRPHADFDPHQPLQKLEKQFGIFIPYSSGDETDEEEDPDWAAPDDEETQASSEPEEISEDEIEPPFKVRRIDLKKSYAFINSDDE